MKLIKKRVLSFLIALSMVVGLMPGMSMTAQAASNEALGSLLDESIGLSIGNETSASYSTWKADGNSIVGTAKGKGMGKAASQNSTELIIENKKSEKATLFMDYLIDNIGTDADANKGSVVVGDTTVSDLEGSLKFDIEAGGKLVVKLTSIKKGNSTTKLTLSNISLVGESLLYPNVTFEKSDAAQGEYTVDNEVIEKDTVLNKSAVEGYNLSATEKEGYNFFGWYDVANDTYVSHKKNVFFRPTGETTIRAEFVDSKQSVFGVGENLYKELDDAIEYAKTATAKKIYLVSNCTLTKDYTIPEGITLLVPFDEANTAYKSKAENAAPEVVAQGKWTKPKAFRTLTLAEGVTLTVEGDLCVSAKLSFGNGSPSMNAGSPSGDCGFVRMNKDSEIIINDGGAAYVYGFVMGQGEITAKSGATVYESIQITDFRGGSASLDTLTEATKITEEYGLPEMFKVSFPFSQYYVQNIEVKTVFEHGATEYVHAEIGVSGKPNAADIKFIGAKGAMFTTTEGGYATKTFLPESDRLQIEVEGDGSINGLAISIGGQPIDSSNFILPINSNITINILSGVTSINQSMALLPGCEVSVAEGATVSVAAGQNLYLYDDFDWKYGYNYADDFNMEDAKYVYKDRRFSPAPYSSATYVRTENDLKDVIVDINGTLIGEVVTLEEDKLDDDENVIYEAGTVLSGQVYTTIGDEDGANVISSKGTGKVLFKGYEDTETPYSMAVIQFNQVDIDAIPMAALVEDVRLNNADGSYTSTDGYAQGDLFYWSKSANKWSKLEYEDEAYAVEVNLEPNGAVYSADHPEAGEEAASEWFPISKEEFLEGTAFVFDSAENLGWEKEGYTFLGWSSDEDATDAEYVKGDEVVITESTTLYAVWKAETFDITYDLDGGFISDDFVDTQSYEAGATVVKPSNPTKEGYRFDAWVDADGNKVTIPETMPAENISVKATYTANRYEITFDNNGADLPANSPFTAPYGASLTEGDYELPTPGRTGYTFTGWKFNDGSDAPATMPAKDFTLIASWAKDAYEFTYEVDGETTTKTVEFGDKLPLPADPEKEGHTFAGWREAEDVYTSNSTMPSRPLIVTATWTKNSYTVTFKDSVSDIVYATDSVEFDSAITEPEAPTKTGYTFAGWNAEIPSAMPAKELVFEAKWTINQYTITFDTDGGSAVAPITQDYNSAVTAPAAPTKTGYTFDGWTPAVPTTMPADNTTVKAQWKVNQYTITFNTNGGSEVAPITGAYGTAVAVPANPTKVGHVFAGWDVEIPEFMPAENMTINANWKVKTGIVIEFDTNGGSAVEPITGSYGDKVVAPEAPTKEGYTFKGWNPELPATMPADKMVVEAQWDINQYTITFDTDGGNAIDAIRADFGTPVTAPVVPTKAGHTFAGWDVEIPSTMPAGDLTIKATWTVNNYKLTFNSNGGSDVAAIEAAYNTKVDAPVAPTKEDYTFVRWVDKDGKEVTFPVTMPIDGMVLTAEWRYSYTGWDTDDNGKTYYNDGAIAYKDTLATIDGDIYYFDEAGYVVTGLVKLADTEVDGGYLYYYFQEDGKALKDGESLWIDETDGILPRYEYEFNEKGEIVHDEDTTKMGIVKENGAKYFYVYGIKAYMGVYFNEADGEYYYVSSSGKLVANRNYWISRANGIDFSDEATVKVGDVEFVEKSYKFDEEGRIVLFEKVKDGIVAEDGSLFYYVDGVRTYAGLIEINGAYYYVRTSGELAHSRNYYTTKHNGLLKAATYTFDAEGKMVNPPSTEVKNGIVEENGGLYYYVNGKLTYAGLIEINGAYYYVRTSGQLVTGRTYWITKHNDLMKEASYEFAEDGKMVNPESVKVKDGIVKENDGLYYYVDGKLTYAGLIEIDGAYYYVKTSGQLVTGRNYWITKTNDLLPEKSYTFNELGQIVL